MLYFKYFIFRKLHDVIFLAKGKITDNKNKMLSGVISCNWYCAYCVAMIKCIFNSEASFASFSVRIQQKRTYLHGLGRLALLLYAGLPYGSCRRNHLHHHRFPGSWRDPDSRQASGDGALRWYVRFMGNYLSFNQLVLLLVSWIAVTGVLIGLEPGRAMNMILFWVLPLVLSSVQLFLFGTYLPHRSDGSTPGDGPAVRSLGYSNALSLLTCYHFGYHWEHHAYPTVPWFGLPELRRLVSLDHGQGNGSRWLRRAR